MKFEGLEELLNGDGGILQVAHLPDVFGNGDREFQGNFFLLKALSEEGGRKMNRVELVFCEKFQGFLGRSGASIAVPVTGERLLGMGKPRLFRKAWQRADSWDRKWSVPTAPKTLWARKISSSP